MADRDRRKAGLLDQDDPLDIGKISSSPQLRSAAIEEQGRATRKISGKITGTAGGAPRKSPARSPKFQPTGANQTGALEPPIVLGNGNCGFFTRRR